MNAQQFLAEFGHIANAPGGVHELRGMILQLAITGGLSSPIESDGNVTQQLDSCRSRIEGAVKDKTYKRIPPSEFSTKAFLLNSIPSHWTWAKLGDISHQITDGTHKTPQYRSQGVVFLSIKNISSGTLDLTDIKYISEEEHLEINSRCNPQKGDILFCRIGTLGRPYIVDMEFPFSIFVSLGLIKFDQEFVLPQYLKLVLKTPHMLNQYELVKAGGAHTNKLNLKVMPGLPIPLPPTEEQFRIVAKVGELMALCDQLEAQQQKRRTLQNHLRQATLQAIAASQSPHELQESWQRLQANFGQLFSAPEDVAQLRSLILDLAVHGLLVERSNVDTPLDTWLEQVKATKAHLVKQKLISKQTAFSNVPEEEYPFPLPKGWAFVRLGQIANKIGSGSTPRGGRKVYVNEGIPFLRSQNVWNDGLRLDGVACIPAEVHERMSGTAVAANDVLLNITGASLGRCALVPADFGEANVSQHVTIIRLTDIEIREYIHLCILSPYTQAMIWGRQVGMAREGLSKKVLEQFEIPLPPIAEQKRIVARVAELMKFCDTLESKLHRTLVVSEHLATASVATLTGIATEQDEEPMKAPKTELVAPVRLGTPPGIKSQAPLATILARHSGDMSAKDLWQRFGGEIDAFYAQLKVEVAHGWILEPEKAEMLEKIEE
ncbi:restriction endonuclease subunit S [Pseudoalteromonas sp. S201]|uniref:restriction endonuclease subunit S n=1 Tax=Pseudoalteromonas sp. S201 TaxID=579519 RepID=UPI00110D0C01|nr:restriction endonuclease subunit S [Pseudoalteromonas sp. S201]TMS95112.1 restriction endonuclease subunit S [Pseudoalteromonas sp. S201]